MTEKIKDSLNIKGLVSIVGRNTKTGEIYARRQVENLVVQGGKDLIATVFNGGSTDTITHLELGLNDPAAAASLTQTALVSPYTPRVAVTKTLNTNPANIVYVATFAPGVVTGNVAEAGLFTALTGGTMTNRTTFASIPKGIDDEIVVTWTVTFG